MKVSGVHHVTLLVDDLDKTAWFYGEVLGLEEIPRPVFTFPGVFYQVGNQEIHIIVRSRRMPMQDLYVLVNGKVEETRRHAHRQAAFAFDDLDAMEERLRAHDVEIMIGPNNKPANDALGKASLAGWGRMYGRVPIFVLDPSENMIELVPASAMQGAA